MSANKVIGTAVPDNGECLVEIPRGWFSANAASEQLVFPLETSVGKTINIAGRAYELVRHDQWSTYGRESATVTIPSRLNLEADSGYDTNLARAGGVVIVSGTKYRLIATYESHQSPGIAVTATERLSEYLSM